MKVTIERARIMLSLNGNYMNSEILKDTSITSPVGILSDEEYRVLIYFTSVGSGKIYQYYKAHSNAEVKDLLDLFDKILQKLGKVQSRIVYRMDTYEAYMDNDEYIKIFKEYQANNTCLQIPWALSVSMKNWNKTYPQHPVWEIELLPNNSKAHPIYPYLEEDKILQEQESEVRFESNTILKIVSVSKQDDFPYIKMKEVQRNHISGNIKSL